MQISLHSNIHNQLLSLYIFISCWFHVHIQWQQRKLHFYIVTKFHYLLQSATFVLPCSGTASGLPTDLRPTLHTALVRVCTTQDVVGLIGIDVAEPDISKKSVLVTFILQKLSDWKWKHGFACIKKFEVLKFECLLGYKVYSTACIIYTPNIWYLTCRDNLPATLYVPNITAKVIGIPAIYS